MTDPRDKGEGWIGVDLDSTLAHHTGKYRGEAHVGTPIMPMVNRVRKWLDEGKDVRIFTARRPHPAIRKFCKEQFGKVLPITNKKDPEMIVLYDDRAVGVEPNTGKLLSKGHTESW